MIKSILLFTSSTEDVIICEQESFLMLKFNAMKFVTWCFTVNKIKAKFLV